MSEITLEDVQAQAPSLAISLSRVGVTNVEKVIRIQANGAEQLYSARLDCFILLLLSADEDDLYCMFFRSGKQLPWFKVGVGRSRRGKERDKLAAKLEALAEVCDAESRARLAVILTDAKDVTFSSDLLRALCDIVNIRNAFTSFDYLARGEREGLDPPSEPEFVSA